MIETFLSWSLLSASKSRSASAGSLIAALMEACPLDTPLPISHSRRLLNLSLREARVSVETMIRGCYCSRLMQRRGAHQSEARASAKATIVAHITVKSSERVQSRPIPQCAKRLSVSLIPPDNFEQRISC